MKRQVYLSTKDALTKIQLAFEFEAKKQRAIKRIAIDRCLSPSDVLRDIIGLSVKKPVRPRITLVLKPEDFETLAKRYGIAAERRQDIQKRAEQEINRCLEQGEDSHGPATVVTP